MCTWREARRTPHGLRTRMCNRTSHPRGFTVLQVSHDTHKAPEPRLCACAATAVSCCTTTSPTGQPEVSLCRSGAARARQSAEQNSVTSQSPLSQKHSVRHTVPQESVHVYLTRSTKDAARAAHAHVQPHVTPTWFRSLADSHSHSPILTHSHSLSLSPTLTSSTARRAAQHSAHENTYASFSPLFLVHTRVFPWSTWTRTPGSCATCLLAGWRCPKGALVARYGVLVGAWAWRGIPYSSWWCPTGLFDRLTECDSLASGQRILSKPMRTSFSSGLAQSSLATGASPSSRSRTTPCRSAGRTLGPDSSWRV